MQHIYMNESTFEFVSSNFVRICDQLLDPFSDARLRRQKSVTLRSRTIDTHRRTMTDKLCFFTDGAQILLHFHV